MRCHHVIWDASTVSSVEYSPVIDEAMTEICVEPDFLGWLCLHVPVPALFVVGLGGSLHEGELVGLALLCVTVHQRNILANLLLSTFLLPAFLLLTTLFLKTKCNFYHSD